VLCGDPARAAAAAFSPGTRGEVLVIGLGSDEPPLNSQRLLSR
jgi:hypothetical protein